MALLERLRDGTGLVLGTETWVGRRPGSRLFLDRPYVSFDHALIRWANNGWTIRDLGSRNGTFLGRERLEVGQARSLGVGASVSFGRAEPEYHLIDVSAPDRCSLAQTNGVEEDTPLWRPTNRLEDLRLELRLEEDRWILDAMIVGGRSRVALGWAEPLIAVLALARLEDAQRPSVPRGWRSLRELEHATGLDRGSINVATYRARGRLRKLGVLGAEGIVEVGPLGRRLGEVQVRLGPGRLVPHKSSVV